MSPSPPPSSPDPLSPYRTGALPLPYWLLNVPESRWPPSCPPFLSDISPRNRSIVNVRSADFTRLSWDQVKETIRANRIDEFVRAPVDHRNYLCFMQRLREGEWGGVGAFVRGERLGWGEGDGEAKGEAFEREGEYYFFSFLFSPFYSLLFFFFLVRKFLGF